MSKKNTFKVGRSAKNGRFTMVLTSNNLAVKKLGPRWQSLHRLVYLATALVFAHWFLSSDYPGAAYQFLGAVLLIEVLRFVRRKP